MSDLAAAPATTAGPSLGARAARGVAVAMTGQGLRIAVQVLSVVVLARLLTPHDYGRLAMVMAVIGVADVFRDLGLSTAAVQARSLSEQQRSNLLWLNTGIGLVLSLLAVALAPAIEAAYGQPQLGDITRVLAWIFLLNGVATQYRADLTRRLMFARLAVADVLAPMVGLLAAVAMALMGAGYWALVAQQLVQYAVMLVLVVSAARWWPGRPSRRTDMEGLLRFGWGVVGVQLVGYAGKNVDSLIIGTRFGTGALGLYNRAFQLLMVPLGQLRAPTTQVALPVLSSLQDQERRYGAYLERGQLAMGHTLVVALAVVVGAAEPITAVFLGERWESVAPLLRLLAVAGAFQTLAFAGYWVYISRGLTSQLVRYSLVESGVRVGCLLVGSNWGLVGVAAGAALGPALTWPLSFWWLSRHAPIPVRGLLSGALRILAVSVCVAAAAWWGARLAAAGPDALALLAAGGLGALAYVLAVTGVPPLRRDARGVLHLGELALRRRGGEGR
jgi:O-antigen/teichoic acid export membrane protein